MLFLFSHRYKLQIEERKVRRGIGDTKTHIYAEKNIMISSRFRSIFHYSIYGFVLNILVNKKTSKNTRFRRAHTYIGASYFRSTLYILSTPPDYSQLLPTFPDFSPLLSAFVAHCRGIELCKQNFV